VGWKLRLRPGVNEHKQHHQLVHTAQTERLACAADSRAAVALTVLDTSHAESAFGGALQTHTDRHTAAARDTVYTQRAQPGRHGNRHALRLAAEATLPFDICIPVVHHMFLRIKDPHEVKPRHSA
jgi:hypothetical protein